MWQRRTAIVSAMYFVWEGDLDDAYEIATILVHEEHDLIHKAVGWCLREAGKQDRRRLLDFLDQHAATMPRTLLRYAMEHLEPELRKHNRSLKISCARVREQPPALCIVW